MTSMVVVRDGAGKLVGLAEKDKKSYGRLKKTLAELKQGEIVQLSFWFPRNNALHRLHFAMLAAFFEQQEQFSDLEQFRAWVSVGAGHAEFVPGPAGRMVALPKSISFRALDDADFQDYHNNVIDFLRTPHATRYLWGHLSDPEQAEMADSILSQFQRSE